MNTLICRIRFICGAVIYCSVISLSAASPAMPVMTEISNQFEVIPDGNILDPKPSMEILAASIANSKKNMVRIVGGTFEMGDWGSTVNKGGLPFDGDPDSKPLHKVILDNFSIGKYPVTYAEFDVFTAVLRIPRINQKKVFERYRKPNNPAGVSWQGAKDYCRWLGEMLKLPIDLPTETQWEFAARSRGKKVLYATNNGTIEKEKNFPSLAQREAAGGMVEVGSFPPNAIGIYNISAGIKEWVHDWYAADYYQYSPLKNPKGPIYGLERVVRGNFGTPEATFRRWHRPPVERQGTWTKRFESSEQPDVEVPYTRYSGDSDSAFRCVINSLK